MNSLKPSISGEIIDRSERDDTDILAVKDNYISTSLIDYQRQKQLQDSYEYMLLFHPPAPEVKTFSIRVLTDEVILTGRRETVVFKDIPAPQPLLKPNAIGPYQESAPFVR